ncbi:conserved hypothetical protein [Methanothermobacter sp. CaT2]|uniref:Uncharacterized protein n=2 Tax=Methanothermobacter TaxID=145260 RepID=A0A371NB21_9EURY|nr:hypothetical protein [Methanothermobacter sp.]REE26233.1 hypothetical protein C7452_1189 [Methanothermobacter defluvii]WBF06199.1 hypothetical protein ISG35_08265 [Methanothermobacter thermautotrophicus]BAM70821.1 conserved hypothetical protein [Methanothermobacter sp. CaT2]MDK2874836.1 hypothetical protein [Methanothermobacter sp.]
MTKAFDILMAGVISGIVAFTTSKLGVGGTVMGAVLGSMLYQLLSHYFREPLKNVKTERVESRAVFAIPLIIIVIIEFIYLLGNFQWRPQQIFYLLEEATSWNLFRSIGVGLMVMGIYPLLQPETIKKSYGYVLLLMGFIVLLRGLVDVNSPLVTVYRAIFYEFDVLITVTVILSLIYMIISIFRESVVIVIEDEVSEENEK